MLLRGCFRVLLFFDVAEAIDLPKLRGLLGPRGGEVQHEFPRRTPDYVRFDQPPVTEPVDAFTLTTGERFACSIKYYAFAVTVVQFEIPFECDWAALLAQASRWIDAPELESCARELVRQHLAAIAPAVIRPNPQWLEESYLVVELREAGDVASGRPSAAELFAAHGLEIAQLIRGEVVPIASQIVEDTRETSLSYYPSDLVVVGPSAALVYDRPEDAMATSYVLEYAKMQLLEFRYYDGLMTRLLSGAYDTLEQKGNVLLSRWSLPRRAQRLNALRLDVMELTERVDNAIKFVSDIYYARSIASPRNEWESRTTATWWTKSCAPWAGCTNS